MNLAFAISVFAGGPGSGCRGDNCGRHSGGLSDSQQVSVHKRGYAILKKSGEIYRTEYKGYVLTVFRHRTKKGPSHSVLVTKDGTEVGKTGDVLMYNALKHARDIVDKR